MLCNRPLSIILYYHGLTEYYNLVYYLGTNDNKAYYILVEYRILCTFRQHWQRFAADNDLTSRQEGPAGRRGTPGRKAQQACRVYSWLSASHRLQLMF